MSEYWVSHKKYFCKYCDIYITDDAPSRRQHETGLRHKGNRERFVRNLYKQGERRKKDLEEEKREMARVEAAANAAFARDISAGHASTASSSSSQTTASRSTAASKKPERPASVWSNYTTAQSLGIIDPDEERLKAEMERRRTQGVVGEWEVVAPPPPPLPDDVQIPKEEDTKDSVPADSLPQKREADTSLDDVEDERRFKLRKRTIGAGLGEIWDPGNIPIKLKSKAEENSPAPDQSASKKDGETTPTGGSETRQTSQSPDVEKTQERTVPVRTTENSTAENPKWQPMRWKRVTEPAEGEQTRTNEETVEQSNTDYADPSIKKEGEQVELRQEPSSFKSGVMPKVEPTEEVSSAKPSVKLEETSTSETLNSTGGLFKKRKVPAGARGRRV